MKLKLNFPSLHNEKEISNFIQQHNIRIIDFRFVDLFGQWQHFSVSASEISHDIFVNGHGFDGSSIKGFQQIHESDMLVIPDTTTAFLDPFSELQTLVLICNIFDPITRIPYNKDARYIAQKAEQFLLKSKIGTSAYFGPEPEFFIFDSAQFQYGNNFSFHEIDSIEGEWNSDSEGNFGYTNRTKEGYFPLSPHDTLQDIRNEMMVTLENIGIKTEVHHHEVGGCGQTEIGMRLDTLLNMADKVMKFKYITKNVAKKNNKTVTFMPKPIFGDNGSGMHVHQSIWKNNETLFAGNEYAGLSKTALYYIGGLLKHAKSLCAFGNPTTNSYKRLVPGFEAPVNLAYSKGNRSASVRIPMYSMSKKSKRVEFRCPDPTANPYIIFSAMLLAGIDGIKNKIDPGTPIDLDIYHLQNSKISTTPVSLDEALNHLEKDYEYLFQGNVFTKDVIETWIDIKRKESQENNIRPTPFEFINYYGL